MDIKEIKKILLDFREERDWAKFHDPKNLAEAISIEASELLELFLWKDKEDIYKYIKNDKQYQEDIADELADVITYCFQMANTLNLDIEEVILNKLNKVRDKYPIEKAKGVATKYYKL